MKLWDKGFALDKQIEDYTVGDDYILDQRLIRYDCLASIAHVKMLHKIKVLNENESKLLIQELENISKLSEKCKFPIKKEEEDCHTAIENHLIKKHGDLGKKIHTARSRNDQVLTALRLYYRSELLRCTLLVNGFIDSLKSFKKIFGRIKLPGYTHTRKAMPSSINLWAGSFIESMKDNLKLLECILDIIDQSPLGSGAGYGIPFDIDRSFTAELLGFKKVQNNPIYTQNSRGKFESSIVHVLSQIMYDLNKISCDIIIFSIPDFGYFILPDDFCTGSSIMPHKKNPDVLELMRAKYHSVVACEFEIKNSCANLISGYNRDIQLTKHPTMRAIETTQQSLIISKHIFSKLKVDKDRCENAMTDELFATDRVYKMVKEGIPFREAYKIVSKDLS